MDIRFYILESFTKNITDNGWGNYWNFYTLCTLDILTLVANVTIEGTNIPLQGIEVGFYYIKKGDDPILLGFNVTNGYGISILKWNTSGYCDFCRSALYASIDETDYHYRTVAAGEARPAPQGRAV